MIRCKDGDYAHATKPVDATVCLPVEVVRACYEGSILERAGAIAALSPIQCERLFPAALRMATHARALRRIGKRIRGEKALRVLAAAPFDVLVRAAKKLDEDEQIDEAMRATLRGRYAA